jgi:hypothetical protein
MLLKSQLHGRHWQEDCSLRPALGKNARPYPKHKVERTGGMAQLVDASCLAIMRPWVQTQVLPPKKDKKKRMCNMNKGMCVSFIISLLWLVVFSGGEGVLGFELRALWLLDRHSTTWAPAFLAFNYFSDRVSCFCVLTDFELWSSPSLVLCLSYTWDYRCGPPHLLKMYPRLVLKLWSSCLILFALLITSVHHHDPHKYTLQSSS